jgi:hypothetical protein
MLMHIETLNQYHRNALDILGIESYLMSQEREIIHSKFTLTYIQDGVWQGDKVSLYWVMDKHGRPVRKSICRNHIEILRMEYDRRGNPFIRPE